MQLSRRIENTATRGGILANALIPPVEVQTYNNS